MKKLCLLFILIAALLYGCTEREQAQIVTTTLPVYEFTSALCEGTGLTVSRLITEEVSCLHDYSVQVSQMQAVEKAEVVVLSGAGLEEFLEDVLAKANTVIDASSGISLCSGHEHEGHHHHDPHIWLSPANAKQMCENICNNLCSLYPDHKNAILKNLDGVLLKLDELQSYGESVLEALSCRELITFHDGFGYFAECFDLHILKAVEEESGSETSAQTLVELIDLVNTHSLPAVFTEKNGSTAAAQIISAETGAPVFALDMAMSGSSYFNAMYHNINTIKEALE